MNTDGEDLRLSWFGWLVLRFYLMLPWESNRLFGFLEWDKKRHENDDEPFEEVNGEGWIIRNIYGDWQMTGRPSYAQEDLLDAESLVKWDAERGRMDEPRWTTTPLFRDNVQDYDTGEWRETNDIWTLIEGSRHNEPVAQFEDWYDAQLFLMADGLYKTLEAVDKYTADLCSGCSKMIEADCRRLECPTIQLRDIVAPVMRMVRERMNNVQNV